MKSKCYILLLFILLFIRGIPLKAQEQDLSKKGGGPTDAYCTAGVNYTGQYISKVECGTIYKISQWGAGGYNDYSGLYTCMNISVGHSITVTAMYGYSTDKCGMWVDWNGDQDFSDANETITVTGTPGLGPYTATITPPAGTAIGDKRLRVRISSNETLGACGQTNYGEVEDYTIKVGGTPPVLDAGVVEMLTPVTAINLTSTESVKVRIRNFGTAPITGFPVSYQINGGTAVTETVTTTINSVNNYDYTFAQTANLSIIGATYTINCFTSLIADENSNNNAFTASVFNGWATNQNVIAGEYFINTDPGEGNGTTITGTYNSGDVTVNITNLTLPVGSKLYVRFKSQNGKWSKPWGYKRENYYPNTNATLLYAEYFINVDPGQGYGTQVTIESGGLMNIPNLNTPVGSKIFVRVKDNLGRWSNPYGIIRKPYFNNSGASLQYAEYFINSDPGQGNATMVTIQSGGVLNIPNLNTPIGSKIYLRVKDNQGRWSNPRGIKRPAIWQNNGATLVAGEYFMNTDPGPGNATPLTFTSGIASITNLPIHKNDNLFVRVKDSYNRWGPARILHYKYKDMQKAEVKLWSGGTYTSPQLMTLVPSPVQSCDFTGLKDIPANAGDSVLVRFQTTEGFYTKWSKKYVCNTNLTAMLAGAYSTDYYGMDPMLNTSGYLPLSQPYNTAPWNYAGTESVTTIPNPNIVDWVLIELRETTGGASTATPDKIISRGAAFITSWGGIVGLDGSSTLGFGITGNKNVYVVVNHRNHVSIMSAIPLSGAGGNYTYDFAYTVNQAYGGTNAQKLVDADVWGMFPGDGNGDGQISNPDKNDKWLLQNGSFGYKSGDFNMDGLVNNTDKLNYWKPYSGKGTQVPY
jgi:hypothetical protein